MIFSLEFWIKFWEQTKLQPSGCVEWTGFRNDKGYGRTRVGNRKKMLCHRIAWVMLHGPIPEDLQVLHDCDNPPCLCHLHLGTNTDNNREMMERGRFKPAPVRIGERSNFSKLTQDQVQEIRRLRGTMSQASIGKIFGVRQSTVSLIHSGKNWAHLQ